MTHILGISGSLRRGSLNTALLRNLAELSDEEVSMEITTLHGIPLYDGDLEDESGIPQEVKNLGERIKAADGVVIASPEYNNSIPGVLKNAVDWLSRLEEDVFAGKSFALVGASPGGFGTILAQNAWLPVFRTLEVHFWAEGRLLVSKAAGLFDVKTGRLTDEKTRQKLEEFIQGFAKFAADGEC